MVDLIIPLMLFMAWTLFSVLYIRRYKASHLNHDQTVQKSFWNNQYIFDSIPPVFPTLGIFCTALGITIGIWNFKTENIQGSIPELLKGLRLAFVATMAGIFGLIVFQKINAVIQKSIDDHPSRPRKQTDELTALSELSHSMNEMKVENSQNLERLIATVSNELESKVQSMLSLVHEDIKQLKIGVFQTNDVIQSTNVQTHKILYESFDKLNEQLGFLRTEQFNTGEKANKNTEQIIKAMSENNKLVSRKFEEFSELLAKNNTEALVEVMKAATEDFNSQMGELIDRLVKENFKELNASVQTMNAWQKENMEQISALTENFTKTTQAFSISATTLKEVASKTEQLVKEEGKLGRIVTELEKVLMKDGQLQEVTTKLSTTVDTLSNTTEKFEETTSKLNDWIRKERNFKESADVLILKLEEFRDFNGNVWDNYRMEMQKAVSIVKEASTHLRGDLENINAEFYQRLNDTLTNLDGCIQRFMVGNR
ncbi:hypothetical protein EPD60_07065 [Flaviaesturariibacter flavus]|uniref:MotA/TolQ/ExbB proton channel domain-containing protein n=1 Tax=Flaviaesturariibacter flavus TaxID=2502780 RepID=A0A4R1BIJ0_9BACT|nr:MotA/TolQ/ExbB proton channel family protein [Flaviaesturariibacter flavus]TCJ17064.1 hypothetical protein EPD60_07065 [Flaviaesturariibacter flavus]